MDAIKKKMQAMKLEKDNAMDRALLCEQQARDANLRAEKVTNFNERSTGITCEIHTCSGHIYIQREAVGYSWPVCPEVSFHTQFSGRRNTSSW
jgi:hypothetical protein